jgi:hypothetical protein
MAHQRAASTSFTVRREALPGFLEVVGIWLNMLVAVPVETVDEYVSLRRTKVIFVLLLKAAT